MTSANSAGVGLAETRIPVFPFSTESVKPVTAVAMVGVPQAAHSVTVMHQPSLTEGIIKAQACCINSSLRSLAFFEKNQVSLSVNSTVSCNFNLSRNRSKFCLSYPVPTITNFTVGYLLVNRYIAWIIRSVRFILTNRLTAINRGVADLVPGA